MVGSELPSPETRERTVQERVLMRIEHLSLPGPGRPLLDDVNISVHAGEIVGIAGVEGNGQTELIEALIGLHAAANGAIELDGRDATKQTTSQRRNGGLGYIPEDRQHDGLVLAATLWENVMLGHQSQVPFARGPWIDRAGAIQRTRDVIDQFDCRTPGPEVPAFTLSGGNQQKLIVGREMLADPTVLLAAHPTRGVDVGAQATIWDIIRTARAKGLGVLLISADLDELIGLSDRLLVMLRGRVVAELDPAKVTPAELGSYMTGAKSAAGEAA
jgi:simple sugar transport system ATP-binding protein